MAEAANADPRGVLEMENASAQEIAAAAKIEIVESFILPNIRNNRADSTRKTGCVLFCLFAEKTSHRVGETR